MIDFIVPLVGSYFSSGIGEYFFFTAIALAFLVSVPSLIRYICTLWR